MFKKTIAFMVSLIFSLAPMTLLAGSHQKPGAKKWDPSEKPVGATQQTQQTQQKPGDKNWDPFDKTQSKAGKDIELNEQKNVNERAEPGRLF